MYSRSVGQAVTEEHQLEHAISTYTERAAAKLRRQNLACAELQVFVLTNPFRKQDPQYNGSQIVCLPVATADSTKLAKAALKGLHAIWRPNLRYKKAGVILLGLTPAASVQGDLWTDPDTPKSKSLMRAMDRINADHGRDTLILTASGRKQPWRLKAERRSPRFTTDWDELLRVA